MTDQNLALLVILDNSSQTNHEVKSVPVFYAHLLQHLKLLYRVVPSLRYPLRYPPIYTAKRTVSKESSSNIPEHLDFYIIIIIVKHVIECFEIGSQNNSRLREKRRNVSKSLGTGR